MIEKDNLGFLSFSERPLGTAENQRASRYITERASMLGFEVQHLNFECLRWERGEARIEHSDQCSMLHPGEYSCSFEGRAPVAVAHTLTELESIDAKGKILFLQGPIAAEPLMPKEFPFYFPEEHRDIYRALEAAQPAAIVAFTGAHPACGLHPFPLISDANFLIPTAYSDTQMFEALYPGMNEVFLKIDSRVVPSTGEQIVARAPAKGTSRGKLVVAAHMDTAYGTPGALDNAAGIVVLLEIMTRLSQWRGRLDLEFIPFNGEDSHGACGQLAWLAHQKPDLSGVLGMVNVDAVGHRGSRVAVSSYGLSDQFQTRFEGMIAVREDVALGMPWFGGDHVIFASRGIPTIALTSSDIDGAARHLTHTPLDTLDEIDPALLDRSAEFLVEWIQDFCEASQR